MKNLWMILLMGLCFSLIGCTAGLPTASGDVDAAEGIVPVNVPDRILFIGNSLTYYNNLPGMLGMMAEARGKVLEIETFMRAGMALRWIKNDADLKKKIESEKWDYVILQSDDISAFPDMYDIEIQTIKYLQNIIRNNHASTQIIYQMIWGGRDGVRYQEINGQYVYCSFVDYINRIREGTVYFADELDLIVAPVGWAWHLAIEQDASALYRLFANDKFHPGLAGSYLGACVFYATLFQSSVSGNSYRSSLSVKEAEFLQDIASSTVLEKLWLLTSHVEKSGRY